MLTMNEIAVFRNNCVGIASREMAYEIKAAESPDAETGIMADHLMASAPRLLAGSCRNAVESKVPFTA